MTQPPPIPPNPGAQPPRPTGAPVPEIPQAPSHSPQPVPPARGHNPYVQRPAAVPPPPQQSMAMPAIQRPPLDAVSVTSVITGAVGLGPVALGLGIAGLRRTSTRWLRSTKIAGAGIALGVIGTLAWLGLGLAAALGAFGGPSLEAQPGDVSAPRAVHASALATGNCVQTLPPQQVVGEVTQVPCATEHLAQVLAVVDLTGEGYPGQAEALALGEQACEAVTGAVTDQSLLAWPIVPTEAAWADGVRTAVCMVRSLAGPMTSSLVT